ncbi:MAG: CvpA family protein [Candidatus Aminicenantes bacterium]|nr:MAG: CvpA family protein [Candidatus Aminicenantes bacterium]
MNWIDVILISVLALTSILGVIKGLVKQVFGLLAGIIGLILALGFYSQVSWIYLRFVSNEVLANFLGFLTIFLAVLCLGWVSSYCLSKFIKGPLKLLNNILGGGLGLLKGILICGVVVFALLVFPISKKALKESVLSPVCLQMTRAMISLIPQELKEKFKEAYQEITRRVEKDGKKI